MAEVKKEERRISPALAIIPVVGLSLGLIGVLAALAWAAPPPIIYTCPYCGDEFATQAALQAHIEAEHPEEPPVFVCPYCGDTFATQALLDAHIELEHPEVPPQFYWLLPTGHIDPSGRWDDAELAYDGWTDTRAEVTGVSPQSWSPPLVFTIPATEVSAVRWWGSSPISPKTVQVDLEYNGAWHNIYEGGAVILWENGIAIPDGTQIVSKARIRFYNPSRTISMKFRVNEFQFFGYAEEPPAPPPPPPTTRLFGYVTDKITGAPIVGATGTVYQDYDTETEDYDIVTDSQGYYEIRDMLYEVDLTQMVIYADGYVTYTNENVPISKGDNQLNVRMVPE